MAVKTKPARATKRPAPRMAPQADLAPVVRRFEKLLIANRGEIACRVMRTAQRMGLKTVAVYSQADRGAIHVEMADAAMPIGPAPASESYLSIEKLIEAAKAAGVEAVHPGYGFLSENAQFANACAKAGLVFVGPPARSIRAMASKSAARALMIAAGVAVVPGYHDEAQSLEALREAATAIGYPIIIKPVAGGGGKGMHIVAGPKELEEAVAAARREAKKSFGDDRLLLEKYISRARHIEVQIFGDTHGNVVSLFERDCTLQRRHQKVIEEAPAPALSRRQREALYESARAAARAVDYVGAGTVEYIYDGERFYFLEMNTRLQVEHGVTEMITGLDLVEWQLRVARGERLPLQQAEIRAAGHAIEARVYAEDAEHGLLPSLGKIADWREPAGAEGIRVDSGFRSGDSVTQFYDPMLAKVMALGDDRAAALAKLDTALKDFQVSGIATNISLLRELVQSDAVAAAKIDTNFIERHLAETESDGALAPADIAAACAAVLAHEGAAQQSAGANGSPWARHDGWMMAGERRRGFAFRRRGLVHEAVLIYKRGGLEIEIAGASYAFTVSPRGPYDFDFALDGRKERASAAWSGRDLVLATDRRQAALHWVDPFAVDSLEAERAHGLTASMSGTVTRIVAEAGADLQRGAAILIIESMKMEHLVRAPADGRLNALSCSIGDFVQQGVLLADFEIRAKEEG